MITTYRQFNSYIRSLDCNNPRQVNGVLTKLFSDIIPEDNIPTNLNEWSQHDKYSVLSYFLLAKEMNHTTTDKFKQNYKASKVMLVDLERGRNMLSETSKQISNILQSCQENAVAKPKTEKKEPRVTIRSIICDGIISQKMTDEQIKAKVKQVTGKEITLTCYNADRKALNAGDYAPRYEKPKTPYIEILSKEELKALASTGKKTESKPVTKPEPVKPAIAKPASPAVVKKAVPVKKINSKYSKHQFYTRRLKCLNKQWKILQTKEQKKKSWILFSMKLRTKNNGYKSMNQ